MDLNDQFSAGSRADEGLQQPEKQHWRDDYLVISVWATYRQTTISTNWFPVTDLQALRPSLVVFWFSTRSWDWSQTVITLFLWGRWAASGRTVHLKCNLNPSPPCNYVTPNCCCSTRLSLWTCPSHTHFIYLLPKTPSYLDWAGSLVISALKSVLFHHPDHTCLLQ